MNTPKEIKKIQILLVVDNRLLREGISTKLKKQDDMNVVSDIGNEENILELIGKLKPNIILIDLGLRIQNSLDIVKLIKREFQKTKIIVMDLIPLQVDVFEYVNAGVSGFMLKDISIAELLKTIRAVYSGIDVLPPNLAGSLFSQIVKHALNGTKPAAVTDPIRMTKREQQIIKLIADGSTNKEIAEKLHLSIHTVKNHVHNILEKLSLNTRVEIAKYAYLSEDYINTNNTISSA